MTDVQEKRALPPALARLRYQPLAQEFLAHAVTEDHIDHAYLFVGEPGSGSSEAAEAFAQCLVCPHGGDGSCDECIRVHHHTHPDVHWMSPDSSVGYLVAQIRGVIEDAQLTPVRAKTKVYILTNAALLRGASANALLKTLEEPPAHVVFILIARSAEACMETIVSRCQVVAFRSIPQEVAVKSVVNETGVSERDARIALAVAQTPETAVQYLGTPSRRDLRAKLVHTLGDLHGQDDWDVLCAADNVVSIVQDPLAQMRKEQKAARDEAAEYLGATALKKLENSQKRELSARERSGMMEVFTVTQSVLRDALLESEACEHDPVNSDFTQVVDTIAAAGTQKILRALQTVDEARDNLEHSVSPQLTLEVMLCAIKEALS